MGSNAYESHDFPLGLTPGALVSLADYAEIGIWNWHIPTNEISLNEPIVKLTGYEMYEVPHSGDSRRKMTFEDDYDMVEGNIRACLEGRQDRYKIAYRMYRKDGSIVYVLESAFVYERDARGNAVRLAGMVTDLSVLKQAGQRVRSLEKENGELREGAAIMASSISRNETLANLNEAREAAMASAKAKSEFLSRMSHEIRTPLNAVIGMATIARKSGDFTQVKYALDKIERSSRQLLAIVNDVLDMSNIDSGRLEITPAPFDLERMVQNALNVIWVRLDEKRLRLSQEWEYPITRQIVADELRLSQVLTHLLRNAVKFTPENGEITLKVQCEAAEGNRCRLRVEVSDTGVGISAESQSKLFSAFEQADGSISRQYGGTGLGLALSKHIINLMGGDIWAESEPGKGAVFTFELPAEWGGPLAARPRDDTPGTAGQPYPAAAPVTPDWSRKTVLLAEDIEINREIIKGLLIETGLQIDTAANGQEAVDLFSASPHKYDAILMDLQMPIMSGLTATQIIRALPMDRAGDIPIVAMTANAFKEDRADCFNAGMNGHIAKPIETDVLYETLTEFLN